MINQLIAIAIYLITSYQSKKHGGWNIYEDEKIKIMYDTYYPNVSTYVKIDGKENLVISHSGHGITQEYHQGNWEKYISDVLYPKAIEAKRLSDIAEKQREEEKRQKLFGLIDDSKVFA